MNRWGRNSAPLRQQLSVFIAGVLIGAALSQAQWSVLLRSINILPMCWVSARPFVTHPDWRWSHAGANRAQRLQTFLVTHEVTHWGETERRGQWARHHWQVQFSNRPTPLLTSGWPVLLIYRHAHTLQTQNDFTWMSGYQMSTVTSVWATSFCNQCVVWMTSSSPLKLKVRTHQTDWNLQQQVTVTGLGAKCSHCSNVYTEYCMIMKESNLLVEKDY